MCCAETTSKTERTHILYQFLLTKVYHQIRKFVYQNSFAYGKACFFSKLLSQATYDLSFVQLEYFQTKHRGSFQTGSRGKKTCLFPRFSEIPPSLIKMKIFGLLLLGMALGALGTEYYGRLPLRYDGLSIPIISKIIHLKYQFWKK